VARVDEEGGVGEPLVNEHVREVPALDERDEQLVVAP
jgi:hypothetical protein